MFQVEVVEGVAGEEDHHDDQEEQGEENAEAEGQHDEHDEDGEMQTQRHRITHGSANALWSLSLNQQGADQCSSLRKRHGAGSSSSS